MKSREIEIGRKTYRISNIDIGNGPEDYVSVKVATPGGVIVSHIWRPVPRDGPTWARVMKAVAAETKRKENE